MSKIFKVKLLKNLIEKKAQRGFTLIELLIVVIIIGILAAIALPNLLNQVAKGRQAEAKNNLGAINRAQQVYRLEELTFASSFDDLPVKLSWQYYNPNFDWYTNKMFSRYYAKAKEQFQNDILDYHAAVTQSQVGGFDQVICEEKSLNSNNNAIPGFINITLINDDSTVTCGTTSKEVK